MSPEDQARYGAVPDTDVAGPDAVPVTRLDYRPSPKTGVERKEQGTFASWLQLQNSKGRKLPFVWHATHTQSKATPGTPDFWVGVNGHSIWIEFKRDDSCKLSPEQEEFRLACEAQYVEHHVVYSAGEAIALVEQRAR